MKRAVVKLKDGYCNLEADNMDADGQYISIYQGDDMVGVFNLEMVNAAYISEKEGK